MKLKGNIFFYITLLLILYIVYLHECSKPCKSVEIPVIKTDTIILHQRDTTNWYVPKLDTILFPKPDTIINMDTVYLESFVKIDTLSILKDFFAKKYYKDTSHFEYGNLVIEDTISQNKIISRRLFSDFQIPKITKNVISYKNPKFAIGVQVGYGFINGKLNPYFGAGIQYNLFNIKTK